MARVAAYIDGFNVYHAIVANPTLHRYKWLDYHDLTLRFCRKSDSIARVYYFSAHAFWDQAKVERHKLYIRALRHRDVHIVLGEFKRNKRRKCRACGAWTVVPEEKRTDVNIAIRLFEDAHQDLYDRALIVSGDSDLIPALEAVKRSFPGKEFVIVVPIGRHAKQLIATADTHIRMKEKHLATSQLPDPLILGNGKFISRPKSWT